MKKAKGWEYVSRETRVTRCYVVSHLSNRKWPGAENTNLPSDDVISLRPLRVMQSSFAGYSGLDHWPTRTSMLSVFWSPSINVEVLLKLLAGQRYMFGGKAAPGIIARSKSG